MGRGQARLQVKRTLAAEQMDIMEADNVAPLAIGILLMIGGIGYAFVKVDSEARKKDERRFGPLSNFGMGLGYITLQNKLARIIVSAITMGLGLIFILSGLGLI
jgi:hypothetical protein